MSNIELSQVDKFVKELASPPFVESDMEFMSDVLNSDNELARFYIYKAIHQYCEDEVVIDMALIGLNDTDWLARVECLEILGDSGSRKAISAIRRVVDNDRYDFCVNFGIVSLGQLGDFDYLKSNVDDVFFENEYNNLHLKIALYLSCNEQERNIKSITRFLHSKDSNVIISCANLLDSFTHENDLDFVIREIGKAKGKKQNEVVYSTLSRVFRSMESEIA